MRSWRLLAVAWLVGCAAPLPRPAVTPSPAAPTLAGVVAPATPRPELVAPLTALLGGDRSDLLLPLGDDTVRCVLDVTEQRVMLDCEDVLLGAATVADLAARIHEGTLMRQVVARRIRSPEDLARHAGLDGALPREPTGTADVAYRLPGALGSVRLSVGERGEVVRATFAGLDGDETIEARSLIALGQRLRERERELSQARRWRADRDRLEPLFASLRPAPSGGWGLHGLAVGEPLAPGARRAGSHLTGATGRWGTWPARWQRLRIDAPADEPIEPPSVEKEGLVLDGVLHQLHVALRWSPRADGGAPPDCAAHDAWMKAQAVPLRPQPSPSAGVCLWRGGDDEHGVVVEFARSFARLDLIWRPARFGALTQQAERSTRPQVRDCGSICQQIQSRGLMPWDPYLVASIDMGRCEMHIVDLLGSHAERDVPCE